MITFEIISTPYVVRSKYGNRFMSLPDGEGISLSKGEEFIAFKYRRRNNGEEGVGIMDRNNFFTFTPEWIGDSSFQMLEKVNSWLRDEIINEFNNKHTELNIKI